MLLVKMIKDWMEITEPGATVKALHFRTINGRVVAIGGPSQGSGGVSAGYGSAHPRNVSAISISDKTTPAEMADLASSALNGKSLGVGHPITIINSDTGQEINAHITQDRLGGKVHISQEVMEYGEPHQMVTSMSTRGKRRGVLTWTSTTSQSLLEEQGRSKESGYFNFEGR